MAEIDGIVGVVVAINGNAEMVDVYESTPLFKKLWPKLLTEPVSVEVCCVEHGRWHRRNSTEFGYLAHALLEDLADSQAEELAQAAGSGKFVTSAGNLSKKARYSAQAGEGQLRVWEEVGLLNSANGVSMASDAFTGNYTTAPAGGKEAIASKEDALARSGDLFIGEPLRHENLAVFPVRTEVVKNDDRFITLDEGLKAGTVEVMEVGARPAANVSAESAGDDPFADVVDQGVAGD